MPSPIVQIPDVEILALMPICLAIDFSHQINILEQMTTNDYAPLLVADVRHQVGNTYWWVNAAHTITRFSPLEEIIPQPNPKEFDLPMRPGRGLTYLVKC